jgi:hypothetical protein
MTGKAERSIKELSPKFPEWTRNFRRVLELYYSFKGSAAFHNLYRINEALWKKRR